MDLGEEMTSDERAAHQREGLALFEMLDKEQRDSLNRRGARAWFRGLGWCLHEAELDEVLHEVGPSSPHSSVGNGVGSPGGGRWVLSQLLDLSEKHRNLCGPDPDALRRCLRDIVGGNNV